MTLIGLGSTTKLSLLWRGSRDRFEARTFHRLCDGRANTLTVIKSTTGYIFGALTSVAWTSPSAGTRVSDDKAFMFTLTNPANMPIKLKILAGQKLYAVVHNSAFGPVFGSGRDLIVRDQSNTNSNNYIKSSSYDAPNGQTGEAGGIYFNGGSDGYFQTVEIEVYQVKWLNF